MFKATDILDFGILEVFGAGKYGILQGIMKKWTVAAFKAAKGIQKLGCCTAYDACFARLADEAGVPCLLVGDSMGMTMLGYDTTLPVKMEETLSAVAELARAAKKDLVVADMLYRMLSFLPEMTSGVVIWLILLAFAVAGLVILIVKRDKVREWRTSESLLRSGVAPPLLHPTV